jgi:hypothetical protein
VSTWFHERTPDGGQAFRLLEPEKPSTAAITYKVGLDLGTVDDFSALSVLEVRGDEPGERRYTVVHLERWRHAGYPEIVQEVASILRRPILHNCSFLVDATGVGLAPVQYMRRAGLHVTGITITGGDEVGHNAVGITVPKVALVGALQVVVQTQRIKVAPDLPAGRLLATEMQAFARRQNPVTGRNQFAVWRDGEHDDLTLAVALPVWHGESRNGVRCY